MAGRRRPVTFRRRETARCYLAIYLHEGASSKSDFSAVRQNRNPASVVPDAVALKDSRHCRNPSRGALWEIAGKRNSRPNEPNYAGDQNRIENDRKTDMGALHKAAFFRFASQTLRFGGIDKVSLLAD
jgi:hypothetical protein